MICLIFFLYYIHISFYHSHTIVVDFSFIWHHSGSLLRVGKYIQIYFVMVWNQNKSCFSFSIFAICLNFWDEARWFFMANGIRTGDPCGFSKRRSSKFCVGFRVRQTPEEGQKTYRPKRCGNKNEDEDNSLKTLNGIFAIWNAILKKKRCWSQT